MVRAAIVLAVIGFALWVYCIADASVRHPAYVRRFRKPRWILITVLLPVVGSIWWLVQGRPRKEQPPRFTKPDPEGDAYYRRKMRKRIEEQRRKAREQHEREKDDPEGKPDDEA